MLSPSSSSACTTTASYSRSGGFVLHPRYDDSMGNEWCSCATTQLAPGAGELLERPDLDVDRAAAVIGIPADELRVAIAEHHDRCRAEAAQT